MAKRKTKKRQTKFKHVMSFEVIGLLLIFLAVFGSGAGAISDGAIPNALEHLFRFFFGSWYFLLAVFMGAVGLYLMAKCKKPNLFHKKLIGLYAVVAGVLLFTHIQAFEDKLSQVSQPSIIKTSWNYYLAYIEDTLDPSALGGGMVGAVLFALCYYLFSSTGAKIVAFFLVLIGVLILSNTSLSAVVQKLVTLVKKGANASSDKMKDKLSENKERKRSDRPRKKPKPRSEKQQVMQAEKEEAAEMTETETSSMHEEPIIQDFTNIAYAEPEQPEIIEAKEEPQKSNEETPAEKEALPASELENRDYQLPSITLLKQPKKNSQKQERTQIQAVARKLEQTFQSFGVKAKVSKVHVGPAVTKYEVYPDTGVKVSKIVNLHDDLALALAAKDIRIEAPIPGKSAVGIEVPNKEVASVSLREVLDNSQMKSGGKLSFALGRDISGESIVAELNKMPHLLVAGATGSGKSVCINGIITSILMRAKPHEVKMMMIDPKKVELNVYNGIPHLLTPVVTDPKKASRALKKVVAEMERRYDLFSDSSTRNIEGYNSYIKKQNEQNEEEQPFLPYIVVLVDELADLMMVASSEVEDAITRLAQMARAAGIHLIIATQRPSVDVITGVIKANIPSRIAFSVSSQIDSRTILDSGGAEKLLGRGDMLFIPVGSSKPTRIQGAFLSDDEVEGIVNHCIEQQKAQYQTDMIPDEETEVQSEVEDELYHDAVFLVTDMQSASVSMLQRRFRVGYTRAARLIDAMEERGVVGPYEGSKPRQVLVSKTAEDKLS
ncbi:FtsK/SpoIIIE family DNA translocase [Terribacillus halophilus]|uniref:FtsK/SpoIIIE family DNA translocase n=1 Tax=Terribacillus halophilus TaxID=361279 RepID=UPI0009853BE6|nr:DNA translocase FtsK [Terribacillus halophilus]